MLIFRLQAGEDYISLSLEQKKFPRHYNGGTEC